MLSHTCGAGGQANGRGCLGDTAVVFDLLQSVDHDVPTDELCDLFNECTHLQPHAAASVHNTSASSVASAMEQSPPRRVCAMGPHREGNSAVAKLVVGVHRRLSAVG